MIGYNWSSEVVIGGHTWLQLPFDVEQNLRKEKKDKKPDKKTSNNTKSSKTIQIQQQQQQHDETISVNSQNSALETHDFNKTMGSMDGLDQISTNRTKSKCVKIEKNIFLFHQVFFFSSCFSFS